MLHAAAEDTTLWTWREWKNNLAGQRFQFWDEKVDQEEKSGETWEERPEGRTVFCKEIQSIDSRTLWAKDYFV